MNLATPDSQIPWTPSHLTTKMSEAMEDYRKQVGRQLRLLREDRSMSQEDAAHLVGVAVKTWHNWESGKRAPYESNWKRISDAFQIDVRPIRGRSPLSEIIGDESSVPSDRLDQLEQQIEALAEMVQLMRMEGQTAVAAVLRRIDEEPDSTARIQRRRRA